MPQLLRLLAKVLFAAGMLYRVQTMEKYQITRIKPLAVCVIALLICPVVMSTAEQSMTSAIPSQLTLVSAPSTPLVVNAQTQAQTVIATTIQEGEVMTQGSALLEGMTLDPVIHPLADPATKAA